MQKTDKKLIMVVGKTHSGKSTFAKELKDVRQDLLIVEADPIAVFMKKQFPELRQLDDREHSGKFNDISLKFRVFLLFVEFALSLDKPIILSNSNMWQKGRALVFDLCKKCNIKVIGVYFNYPEEVLRARIKSSDRSLDVLRISKDFDNLLSNQKDRMQAPESLEFDEFFVIRSEADANEVKNKLLDIL